MTEPGQKGNQVSLAEKVSKNELGMMKYDIK